MICGFYNRVMDHSDQWFSFTRNEGDGDGVTRDSFGERERSVDGVDAPEGVLFESAGIVFAFFGEEAEFVIDD